MTELRIGVARVDITPDWPLPLAGFASRRGVTERVFQPIRLRLAVLESSRGGAVSRACVASADLLCWPPELLPVQRHRVAEITGVPAENIMFCATHSHSGPQPQLAHAPASGCADPRYLALFDERLREAARAASDDLEPVTVWRARGTHDLGVNRRRVVDGRARHGVNPDGPRDNELTAIVFRRTDSTPKGVFVHYTCHPVVSAESAICGDFTGDAMSRLEKDGLVALYLQGCCGDINPGTSTVAGLDEVTRQGRALAEAVSELLPRASRLRASTLRSRWHAAELPFGGRPSPAEIEAASGMPGVSRQWAMVMRTTPDRIRSATALALQRLDVAEDLALLAMNGEPSVSYGLDVRAVSRRSVLPVGYGNGMIGYIPTATQIAEGGYEPVESCQYYLLPSSFSPAIDENIRRALTQLAASREIC